MSIWSTSEWSAASKVLILPEAPMAGAAARHRHEKGHASSPCRIRPAVVAWTAGFGNFLPGAASIVDWIGRQVFDHLFYTIGKRFAFAAGGFGLIRTARRRNARRGIRRFHTAG